MANPPPIDYEPRAKPTPEKPPTPPTLLGLFLQTAVLGLAIYWLFDWKNLSTSGRIGAVILLLFALLMIALHLLHRLAQALGQVAGTPSIHDPEKAGEEAAARERAIYTAHAEYRDATDADWKGLDREYYQRCTDRVTALGFTPIGDVVNESARRAMPSMKSVIRSFLNPERTIVASISHVRFYGVIRLLSFVGLLPGHVRCVEFESEITNGEFLTVSNMKESIKTLPTPGIHRLLLPRSTPIDELMSAFTGELSRLEKLDPPRSLRSFKSREEVLDAMRRMDAKRGEFRASDQHEVALEMQEIAGRPLTESELELAAAQERARARHREAPSGARNLTP